jgi:hypothetical protein
MRVGKDAAHLFPGSFGGICRPYSRLRETDDSFKQGIDRGLNPGAYVVSSAFGRIEGSHVGFNDIAHENVIPGLLTVAEDEGRLGLEQLVDENGNNASLSFGTLPGSVDIRIPEHDRWNTIGVLVIGQITFAC